jgi:hypothetical protein
MKIFAICLLVACGGCNILGRTDRLVLDHAALAAPSPSDDFDRLPVRGHRITSGSGTVIAYRTWSPGSIFAIDDEHFEKLTLFLPDTPPTTAVEYQLGEPSRIVLEYTVGGSAWPKHACFGSARSGTLHLHPGWLRRLHVDVQFEPQLRSVIGLRPCPSEVVHRSFTAVHASTSNLTPWLGTPGPHVYSETYP